MNSKPEESLKEAAWTGVMFLVALGCVLTLLWLAAPMDYVWSVPQ